MNSFTGTGPRPIFFHGLDDLENFLVKSLDVDMSAIFYRHGGVNTGYVHIRDSWGGVIFVAYSVYGDMGGAIQIYLIGSEFTFFRAGWGCKKGGLYQNLREWYTENQFKRLENVFS